MLMILRISLILLVIPFQTLLGGIAIADDPMESRVNSVLKTPEYANAHWGLLVIDRTTGRTLYEKNADQLFGPASVTKLFSTAAALVELGADYRFQG